MIKLDRKGALDMIERCPFMPAVIWSGEHGAYWREHGWTRSRDEAERHTIAKAVRLTLNCRPEKKISFELVDFLQLDFALPPSTNQLFVEAAGKKKGSGRQRVKTAEYKAWIELAGLNLKTQLSEAKIRIGDDPLFAENFGLWIRLDINHQGDITNRIKALEDFLVAAHVTTGDQWNDRALVERDREIPTPCRVVIYREVQ